MMVPLVIVFALEAFFWGPSGRWSLLYPAVFACAWFGGFESGIAATFTSLAIMWWYFVPPEHVVVKPAGPEYLLALAFVLAGAAISTLLRRTHRNAVELSRNQRLLQAVLDYSPEAIVIKDLEGRYVMVNKAFETLRGINAATVLHHSAHDVFPRAVAEDMAAKEQIVRETRQPILAEEATGTDGRVLLLSKFPLKDESNAVFGIGAIETDITQRKHDEEALRETMEDLRTAQHVSHVGSWHWDFRTNAAKWSDELYRIVGLDASRSPTPLDHLGAKLLTSDSLERLRGAMDKLRRDGEPYDVDLEFTRLDGSVRWCATRGEAARDDSGHIIGINGTVADITHIKELERLREEWTSIIAHDLRQPVSVISMASEFLPTLHEKESKEERDTLESIRTAAQTLKRMVDDLLDMSLLDAHRLRLERRWIDAGAALGETLKQLSHLPADRLKVSESGPPVSIFVDPMRMGQVLGNLISNAVRYGDANTPVEVCLDRTDREVTIAVTNRGQGLSRDDLARLFDRFMRSRKGEVLGAKGLGLGLYISKGIVEAHGGRIWADSVPGETTTFHVSLPVTVSRQAAA